MKKLVCKLIILGIGTLIIVMTISAGYLKRLLGSNEIYNNMPYGIKLANTGSSHGAHAFDYSIYDGAAFNFAMGSQSIEYDNNLINYYIDHFEKDSVLLIPISYFTFWYDELKSGKEFDNKNMRYFSILDIENMRFKSKKDYYTNKCLFATKIADIQVRSVFSKAKRKASSKENKRLTLEEIGEKRAIYHLRHMLKNNVIIEMSPSVEASLTSLIKLCKEKEITPVLITTPYSHYYSKVFSDIFLSLFYNKINKICNQFNVNYLDYSKDERFAYKEELFMDTDHLNEVGAKKFTKIVIDDLNKLKLL